MHKYYATHSRQQFLAAAGTLVALPFLESVLSRAARAQAPSRARRLVLFHSPASIVGDYFFTSTLGRNFTLPLTLSALGDLKGDILVLSNMANMSAKNSQRRNGQGLHSLGMATLFTGANLRLDVPSPLAATSVDQIYAQFIAGQTPVGSLQLARDGDFADCDSGMPARPFARCRGPTPPHL